MYDTWDIVKTQEHEEAPEPWKHVYKWNGSKYIISSNPYVFWQNLFPKAVINHINDAGAFVTNQSHSINDKFIDNQTAYLIAEMKWS